MIKSSFKKKNQLISAEKYFRRYIKIAPLSVALCRSVEAWNFSTIKMPTPLLDIGCGFGEFAMVFFDKPVAMGVDNAPLDLYAAAKTKKYQSLLLADARQLPLANESFATVMSVSTMEHIKNANRVFDEVYRVLKPNGIFVLTMETNEVDKHTFYRPLLNKIGLSFISRFLTRSFNMLFHRHLLLSQKDWEKRIKNAGFIIEESRTIVSPTIIKLFDIFILTAWPSQLLRSIFGKRIVYRPQFMVDLLTKIFLKFVAEETPHGTVLFLVARKS